MNELLKKIEKNIDEAKKKNNYKIDISSLISYVIEKINQKLSESKANNESELITDKFKNELNKKLENKYPISMDDIYKIYFELQKRFIFEFCTNVENHLKISQINELHKSL